MDARAASALLGGIREPRLSGTPKTFDLCGRRWLALELADPDEALELSRGHCSSRR